MSDPAEAGPALVIEDGAQSGARTSIGPGLHSIGSDLSSDVVLFDPAMAGAHFTLEPEPDGVRLRALGGAVSLADGTELAPGETTLCGQGARFRAGATRFCIHDPRASPPRRSTSRVALASLGVSAACVLLAVVGIGLAATPAADAILAPGQAGSSRAEASAAPARSAPAAASVLEAVRARLASAGLETISLAALPDGSVAARGQIAPPQEASWRDAQRWFDGLYGGRAVLVDQVRIAAEAPPLSIQAVWPGPTPYVIDGDGEKLLVGAAVPGGWAIASISAQRVLLRRGAQTLGIRF